MIFSTDLPCFTCKRMTLQYVMKGNNNSVSDNLCTTNLILKYGTSSAVYFAHVWDPLPVLVMMPLYETKQGQTVEKFTEISSLMLKLGTRYGLSCEVRIPVFFTQVDCDHGFHWKFVYLSMHCHIPRVCCRNNRTPSIYNLKFVIDNYNLPIGMILCFQLCVVSKCRWVLLFQKKS